MGDPKSHVGNIHHLSRGPENNASQWRCKQSRKLCSEILCSIELTNQIKGIFAPFVLIGQLDAILRILGTISY